MITRARATVEDLYRVSGNGKAELVNGELVLMNAAGDDSGLAGGEIFAHLREHARQTGQGRAYPDNVGFLTDLPNRQSFSPDVAFYTGPRAGLKFLPQPPLFAVEVRSEGDYGPQAEREMAQKRADYFAAGTQVVWDVDLLGADVIRSYRAPDAHQPAAAFRRGETAHAEPAVRGWTMPVDDLFLA